MAWWAVTGWASPHTFQVSSPDRNYVFTFTQEEPEGKTRMYYTLSYKGKEIVHRSELGVEIENKLLESALGIENDACKNWRDNLTFIGADSPRTTEHGNPYTANAKKSRTATAACKSNSEKEKHRQVK